MGRKPKKFSEKEVAKYIITSKESAEVFIQRWMERHKTVRESALKKLKELDIEFSKLPDSSNL